MQLKGVIFYCIVLLAFASSLTAELKLPEPTTKEIIYEGTKRTINWYEVESFLPSFPEKDGKISWWTDSNGSIFNPILKAGFVYFPIYCDEMWISWENPMTLPDGSESYVHVDGIAPTLEPVWNVPNHSQLKQACFRKEIIEDSSPEYNLLSLNWKPECVYLFGVSRGDIKEESSSFGSILGTVQIVLEMKSPEL